MAVPKQRKTKSRRNNRRANIFLKAPSLTVCPKCAKPVLRHTMCANCGTYKGKEFIDVMKKLTKKEKKAKAKEIESKEGEEAKDPDALSMEGLSKSN